MEDGSLSNTTLAWPFHSADHPETCCLTSASGLWHLPRPWDCHPGTCIARSCHKQGLPQPAVSWLEAVEWRHMQITGGGAEHGKCAYPLEAQKAPPASSPR